MFNRVLTSIFGSRNERVLRQLSRIVTRINALEPEYEKLDDEALRGKTVEFKQRVAGGESLDKLLPEAFAVVREGAKRVLGMRHYDVQLIGGMVLHQGKIAEMRTGEGKTLVGTLPVYLNALEGKGVHVVTVNDYLARRDSAQMGKLYSFLGLTTDVVWPGMDHADKHKAYAADITYGTNNEFGFDYLRDNMALSKEQRYQRGLNYAIVDEVDSILIDEARTPLIISGPAEDSPQLYIAVNKIVPRMIRQKEEESEGDFWVDEKQKQVHLSEDGMQHADELLRETGVISEDSGLYDSKNLAVVHHLNAALRANAIYQRDVDYIVRDGEVIIVDEFTGRTLPGRRWSDGLHQAVEAKEGVPIQRENQTLATVTFQNLFRMYKKLAGMTGTADTEAFEFQSIYGLEVVVIPTHKPMIRKDNADLVFLGQQAKYNSVIEDIKDCHKRGQPVLVGTTSIEVSELLSNQLRAQKIPHEVLNAKQHEREAHIVAQAGAPGSVTIATNMAGRGTDIVLGGSLEAALAALPAEATDADRTRVKSEWKKLHEQVLAAGGLHIIGTERHESRRIDNQLRGRSGRQGDPGSSRFFLSLEDNLLRIFGGEGLIRWMKRFGMKENDALEDKMISRQIEKAQRKVEQHNFDIRKHLLEFDDVANDQRKVIYRQRDELLEGEDVSATVADVRNDVVESMVRDHVPPDSIDEQWDIPGLDRSLESRFGLSMDLPHWLEQQKEADAGIILEHVRGGVDGLFQAKEAQVGAETMRALEKHIMLTVVDNAWKEHLANMDYLRQGIYLVGYAQQDPKQAFKRESFRLFSDMLDRIKGEVVQMLARIRIRSEEEVAAMEAEQQRLAENLQRQMLASGGGAPGGGLEAAAAAGTSGAPQLQQPDGARVGRNDPCPCGSGKKYKHCHGQLN
ncbi:preprotein translocase subunit SecA [Rhodanobacter sp. DHG33]|uniref:preprotein translocase subunit SecA n=1 Tax=Rhodanobacter sp. DHG33 TaxID=2775921 RepID=UPI001780EDDC|nr:preprotein translocase subunit SecA [Rhodanobacter sp. DHG33]MBD8899466.1 preprotein translocase subunit SecA [Rhodanobacter sp. DHG33]